ncbi:MAG: hypothetical protein K2X47_20060 [Bdellovibrionales bacterium]|nr:hypothetical protein [Bdellovibrionales bacterium]
MLILEPQLEQVLTTVLEMKSAYRNLSRFRISRRELLEYKFLMQGWRCAIKTFVMDRFWELSPAERSVAFRILADLDLYIPRSQLKQMVSAAVGGPYSNSLRRALNLLSAAQGYLDFGPQKTLDIPPVDPSRWPFEKWSKFSEFADYQIRGHEVTYRGICYRPGDLLVNNLNSDSNGIFTAANHPESFAGHLGIFVLLKSQGKTFPSVIEVYQNGVRAIPLSQFLHPDFTSYVEVYRLKEIRAHHFPAIHQVAVRLLQSVLGYSFFTETHHEHFSNCTGILSQMLEEIGLAPVTNRSSYSHRRVQTNLARLGFHCKTVLTPLDVAVDPRFEFLGVVDNGHFKREAARLVAIRTLIDHYLEWDLDLAKMPLSFRIYRWAIGHIRKRSLLGRQVLRIYRFRPENFPLGPDLLIAIVELSDRFVKHTVRRTHVRLGSYFSAVRPFRIFDFVGSPEVQTLLNPYRKKVSSYFRMPKLSEHLSPVNLSSMK